MSRRRTFPRPYRHSTGQSCIRLNGKSLYLGKWGSLDAEQRYARLKREWDLSQLGHKVLYVFHLVERYALDKNLVEGAKLKPDDSLRRSMVRELLRLERVAQKPIGKLCAGDLESLLHHLASLTKDRRLDGETVVISRYSRSTCNKMGRFFRQMIRWCERKGHAPPGTWHRLAAAEFLRYGETDARESEKVQPVCDEVVNATLSELSPVLADLVRFQRLVGCRPDEACRVRLIDTRERTIDTDAGEIKVLLWTLREHKTKWRNHERIIAIGPCAQMILTRNASATLDAPVFRTPQGSAYRRDSYTRAVARAANRAGVEHWTPNQLRHAGATEVDELSGFETANAVLGHANLNTTGIYVKKRTNAAIRAAAMTG